jgi:hypothetical protein
MSRGPQTFKQGDATKAIKATVKAGLSVKRVEFDRGKIIVITGDAPPPASTGNEWDDVQ